MHLFLRVKVAALLALLAGVAGLATAAQLPACSVGTALNAPARAVTAGRVAKIKLAVKAAEGLPSLDHLNVAINLPSNCCMEKGGVRPSLKTTTSPTRKAPIVEGQNVYWLDVPRPTRDKTSRWRLFFLAVRMSSLYITAATVPITAMVYATNATGAVTCASTARPASVRIMGDRADRRWEELLMNIHVCISSSPPRDSCESRPPPRPRLARPRPPWSVFARTAAPTAPAATREWWMRRIDGRRRSVDGGRGYQL